MDDYEHEDQDEMGHDLVNEFQVNNEIEGFEIEATNANEMRVVLEEFQPEDEAPSIGLDVAQINRLPRSTATAVQIGMECSICMEDYDLGTSIRTLPCFHLFHSHCVDA